jgi:hypothetical protein
LPVDMVNFPLEIALSSWQFSINGGDLLKP